MFSFKTLNIFSNFQTSSISSAINLSIARALEAPAPKGKKKKKNQNRATEFVTD